MKEATHIDKLRTILMEQLAALQATTKDELNDALRKSKGMAELAQVLVNSAKVEVEYIAVVKGASDSAFLQAADERPEKPPALEQQSVMPSLASLPMGDPERLSGPARTHPWRGNVTKHRGA